MREREPIYAPVQFPDLTELMWGPYGRYTVPTFKTEFSFYIEAPGHTAEVHNNLTQAEFQPVSCMNNWWPSHCSRARKLVLWWRKHNKRAKPQPTTRAKWCTTLSHMAGSGCGFKIGELPLKANLFHRFFTLMRMPVEVSEDQQAWLKKHNFRHLDTGSLASYYVNGWDPTKYNLEAEFAYFGITEQWWKENGRHYQE